MGGGLAAAPDSASGRPSRALGGIELRVTARIGRIRARTDRTRPHQHLRHQPRAVQLGPHVPQQSAKAISITDVPLERHGASVDELAIRLGRLDRTALRVTAALIVGKLRRVDADVAHSFLPAGDPNDDRVTVHDPHDLPVLCRVDIRWRWRRIRSRDQDDDGAGKDQDQEDADEPLRSAAPQRCAPPVGPVTPDGRSVTGAEAARRRANA